MTMQKKDLSSWFAKGGAVAYFIWALLHFQAAWGVYKLGDSMPPGMASGRVEQDAWNLFCFALCAALTSILLNWRNDIRGWWINLAVVSSTDIGFIIYILIPGYTPIWPGILGPLFWAIGFIFSTCALVLSHKKTIR
ncbi:TPA: hypothetical protein JHK27_000853 [Serratia marcescens]|uniref:hypothetical protein n=1 Tax=Serratia marcescens TaxID=615 RepID=UPI00140C3277|nr:hypothetical protein [Serratia marcescens]QIO26673.1 hypothetical protein HAP49_05890 [Serratia marcescens]HAV2275288.1 hypothetical protein [Serratia marcescens]